MLGLVALGWMAALGLAVIDWARVVFVGVGWNGRDWNEPYGLDAGGLGKARLSWAQLERILMGWVGPRWVRHGSAGMYWNWLGCPLLVSTGSSAWDWALLRWTGLGCNWLGWALLGSAAI